MKVEATVKITGLGKVAVTVQPERCVMVRLNPDCWIKESYYNSEDKRVPGNQMVNITINDRSNDTKTFKDRKDDDFQDNDDVVD